MPGLDRIPSAGTPRGRGAVDTILDTPVGRASVEISVDLLDPHPDNPRDEVGDVEEMSVGMRQLGVLEPLLVATAEAFRAGRLGAGDEEAVASGRYVILAGHRRLAAARKAELATVPCIIRDDLAADVDAITAMLLENLHRDDLSHLQEARGYALLIQLGKTQEEVAALVGRSQAHISKKLALLKLPEQAQARIGNGLTVEDAVKLAAYADDPDIVTKAATTDRPSWKTVDQVAADLRKERERKVAVDALKEKLRAKGIMRFAGWSSYGFVRSLDEVMRPHFRGGSMKVDDLKATGVDVRDHDALPCHGAAVGFDYTGRLQHAIVCLKPKNHAGDVKARVDRAEDRARREAEKAAARAGERRELVRALLAGKPTKDLNELVDALLIRRQLASMNRHAEVAAIAAMLGLEPPANDSPAAVLAVFERIGELADGNAAARARVLAAVTLAKCELDIDRAWGDKVGAGAYLRFLQSQGHEPAGAERKLIGVKR